MTIEWAIHMRPDGRPCGYWLAPALDFCSKCGWRRDPIPSDRCPTCKRANRFDGLANASCPDPWHNVHSLACLGCGDPLYHQTTYQIANPDGTVSVPFCRSCYLERADRCPRCASDDPAVRLLILPRLHEAPGSYACDHDWHDQPIDRFDGKAVWASLTEEEKDRVRSASSRRTMGGGLSQFCMNMWHRDGNDAAPWCPECGSGLRWPRKLPSNGDMTEVLADSVPVINGDSPLSDKLEALIPWLDLIDRLAMKAGQPDLAATEMQDDLRSTAATLREMGM